jgi:hypothetical protein
MKTRRSGKELDLPGLSESCDQNYMRYWAGFKAMNVLCSHSLPF